MPDCKACGKWFATMEQCELCPTCERALERLSNYAAPVVRCKDCVDSMMSDNNEYIICCRLGVGMEFDDFCSYGERKDGKTDGS